MQEPWSTVQDDLSLANEIIDKYVDLLAEGEELPMPRIVARLDNALEYWMPEWMLEIAETFSDRYGIEQGDYVTRRVFTHYLLQGKTIH